ncbi:MAG: bifunctional 3-(3-hydroxy-phenyl)propionate/3-hydroxycinnamic acid hydroxylase [Pseudomonadota bacterium]
MDGQAPRQAGRLSMIDHDVIIVGLGPVGALLANFLGQRGHQVVVLERDHDLHDLPRAVHFDGEVMRAFQNAGLATDIENIARASTHGMHFVDQRGETLMIRRSTDGPGPQGWASNWYFHQPDLDAVLRRGITRFKNVEVRLGHEVTRIEEAADRVTVESRNVDQEVQRRSARYLIGCDGSHSIVRRMIDSAHEDLGLHQPWLVVDVITKPGNKRADAIPPYTVQHCDPARPRTRVYVGKRRHRWEIMLLPGEDPEEMVDPKRFWSIVDDTLQPTDGEVERAAIYSFHALIADRWQTQRLFLAGDSCHQTPPFLGQGLCAGVRDAFNLQWKLDLVLRGECAAEILQSYQSERRTHVRAFIELAVRLGRIIQATQSHAVAKRDAVFTSQGTQIFDFPQPRLGRGLHIGEDGGRLLPQPRIAGRLLDRIAQGRFTLISADPPGIELPPHVHYLERNVCEDPTFPPAVLLRPDGYVFGSSKDAATADELLRRMHTVLR